MASNDRGLNKRARELEALNAVAISVSRSLDLDNVIQEAVDQILTVTVADACAVYLQESGSGDLVLAAIEGVSDVLADDRDIERVLAGVSWWGQMVAEGEPILRDNIGMLGRPLRDAVIREGLRSAAYVPLQARGHINGAIVSASKHRYQFGVDDLELLSAIGEQVGVAVDNARLFNSEQVRVRQLALINEVGQRITATLEVDDVVERVVTALHTDFGYQHAAVVLLDSTGQVLESRAYAGELEEVIRPKRYRQSVTEGMMGRCARTGEVVLANDVTQDPDYFHLEDMEAAGSELCAPIKAGEQVLGVLNVESDCVNTFDDSDVMVIQTLADQLGIALQNAWLFERQEQQLTKLQTLHEVARTISSSLDPD